MALKGTTRIELTNVKTGEREVIQKDNLVTNAVASILDNPFAWQLKSTYSSTNLAGNVLPLCPNLFGGILLYEDAVPESAEQLYAQPSNKLVGYASNNVNNLTDIMRGSLNLNESGALASHDGYRFVFDFTTAQANGTISSVGLTSKWGGIAGYGSLYFENTQSPTVLISTLTENAQDVDGYVLMNMVHYNADTGIATSVYTSSQNTLAITRIQLHTKNWKLTGTMRMADATQIVDSETIETKVFAGTTVSGNYLYQNFCDDHNGYIWGFEHAANAQGNQKDKASVNWIKIKIDDLTFEEGTWELDAQIYTLGRRASNPGTSVSARYSDQANCTILDNYLYCINYTKTGLYRIKLSNITDVQFIEHPEKNILLYDTIGSDQYYYFGTANLGTFGNKVCTLNSWLNVDELIPNKVRTGTTGFTTNNSLADGWIDTEDLGVYPCRSYEAACSLAVGVFLVRVAARRNADTVTMNTRLLLNSPYLATINNLPTPVQKTADKTMKITYILREES